MWKRALSAVAAALWSTAIASGATSVVAPGPGTPLQDAVNAAAPRD